MEAPPSRRTCGLRKERNVGPGFACVAGGNGWNYQARRCGISGSATLARPVGFARPNVHRINLNQNLPRNFQVWEEPPYSVQLAWRDVANEVVARGLRLGVRFDLPACPLGGAT